MSLESWKAEFYPVPAKSVGEEDAIAHSLRKWRGLTKRNLKKHGLVKDGRRISEEDGPYLSIDADSCCLCTFYLNSESYNRCSQCPLKISRGSPCDQRVVGGESRSPYHSFLQDDDPSPMISLLREAAKHERNSRQERLQEIKREIARKNAEIEDAREEADAIEAKIKERL